jgi:hypothetical protein
VTLSIDLETLWLALWFIVPVVYLVIGLGTAAVAAWWSDCPRRLRPDNINDDGYAWLMLASFFLWPIMWACVAVVSAVVGVLVLMFNFGALLASWFGTGK